MTNADLANFIARMTAPVLLHSTGTEIADGEPFWGVIDNDGDGDDWYGIDADRDATVAALASVGYQLGGTIEFDAPFDAGFALVAR